MATSAPPRIPPRMTSLESPTTENHRLPPLGQKRRIRNPALPPSQAVSRFGVPIRFCCRGSSTPGAQTTRFVTAVRGRNCRLATTRTTAATSIIPVGVTETRPSTRALETARSAEKITRGTCERTARRSPKPTRNRAQKPKNHPAPAKSIDASLNQLREAPASASLNPTPHAAAAPRAHATADNTRATSANSAAA